MTRITNVDQVLLLLRSHLQRSERSRRTSKADAARLIRRSPLERIGEIAAGDQSSDEDIRRALVAGILTEELGAGFASDARFQDLVNDVVRIISGDEQTRALFDKALEQLAGGR